MAEGRLYTLPSITVAFGGGRFMAGGRPSAFDFFTCLNCKALYQLVKVEAGPETVDQALSCLVCGVPLPSREAEFVLKYFLLRKAARRRTNNKLHQMADRQDAT